jgi:hypothetical protein
LFTFHFSTLAAQTNACSKGMAGAHACACARCQRACVLALRSRSLLRALKILSRSHSGLTRKRCRAHWRSLLGSMQLRARSRSLLRTHVLARAIAITSARKRDFADRRDGLPDRDRDCAETNCPARSRTRMRANAITRANAKTNARENDVTRDRELKRARTR